jgi:malonyl-CoA decarboxylase
VLAEHPVAFRLLQELNKEEDGPRLLVKVRSKLRTDPGLWKEAGLLDSHLVRMLREAFGDRSTLELRQVIWAEASPELTKFIAQNDRVRPPTSENEVQDRLTATGNRRCFAFFSSRMLACEPVCFVHVALSQGTIDRISALPGTKHTVQDPDTATFYSINSPFTGLYGVRDFGNSLIKSTASLLKKQHPSILRFCTLSPVPGFRKWLEGRAAGTANMDVEALTLQCQEYLNPATTADPVARFHYRNGAHLRRVLADADKR